MCTTQLYWVIEQPRWWGQAVAFGLTFISFIGAVPPPVAQVHCFQFQPVNRSVLPPQIANSHSLTFQKSGSYCGFHNSETVHFIPNDSFSNYHWQLKIVISVSSVPAERGGLGRCRSLRLWMVTGPKMYQSGMKNIDNSEPFCRARLIDSCYLANIFH